MQQSIHQYLIGIVCLAFIGCGTAEPERGSLSGTVTFDGQPVELGTIRLTPTGETKGPVAGGEIKAGKYRVPAERGPVVGLYEVEITALRETGETIPALPPATEPTKKTEQYLPARYNTESTLTVEIVSGENTKDFALKSK